MRDAFLGNTGVRASSLCFGTMYFGGDADESTSAALFGRARDAGINLFDCADVYAGRRSEQLLGQLLVGCRGARNLEQLEGVLAAAEIELDKPTRARISALSPAPPPATDRNEETSAHNYGSR